MNSKRIAAARSRVYIIVTAIAALLGTASATGLIPEYTAAEARKHIGEKAVVVGTVDDIGHGRRHVDLVIGGRDLRKAQLWIVVPAEASGPELDPEQIRHVTIAVTGKIESSMGTPQITIKSTTQIVPRTALQTNYIGRAYDKEQSGDLDGAIQDLNQAIEHQPDRRNEACEHLARVKERRGDWAGALAAYDRLVALDPNNANSYYVRAEAKKQHDDFEGAMADFTRVAELRASASDYDRIGDFRKIRGDLAGAMAEYDKAIALCDKQIAEPSATADIRLNAYYQRAFAKQLKGDLDGAIADFTRAIAINPTHAAGAFNGRGDVRKAKGDLAGAIADYQRTVEIAHHPIYKEKLDKTKAEAKTRAKNVVKQPSIQAAQNEESFNKSEVTPESIAEVFVQAYSGTDVDALASLYADRVDHTKSGVISNAAVRAQAKEYFARWPVRHWSLVGTVNTISLGISKKKVIFSATYDASDPQTDRHASGIAKETLILATDPSGAMKIVSQKEQVSKGNTTQPGGKTSEDANFETAKAEYNTSSHDEATRVRYVTKLADIYYQLLQNDWATGEKRALEGGDLVFEELTKHPAQANSDSKKLSQLLVGEWASPRHGNPYVFRADGKWGRAGSLMDDSWRIKRSQFFARDATGKIDEGGTIILLNNDYFIYADGNGYVTFYARFQKALSDTKRIQKQAEVASQQTPPGTAVSRIVSTEVVDIPPAHADSGIKTGNIKVAFSDGHTEVLIHTGDCHNAKVSARGNVGWIRIGKTESVPGPRRTIHAGKDSLAVRLPDGTTKKFPPFGENVCIMDWRFTDDDKTLIVRSMGYHGPSSYVQYDLASGKVIDSRGPDYTPYPELPPWAKPLAFPDE